MDDTLHKPGMTIRMGAEVRDCSLLEVTLLTFGGGYPISTHPIAVTF